jgi:endoglucanase
VGPAWIRRSAALGALAALALTGVHAAAPTAHAAGAFDPNGFHFSQPHYYVDEDAGNAVITVERTDTSRPAQVQFITTGQTASLPDAAEAPYFFTTVKSGVNGVPQLHFAAGQSSATFTVPVVDHGANSIPFDLELSLFGAFPTGLGDPSSATLTIVDNDPVAAPDPANPLDLPGASTTTNPLLGAKFFVDPQTPAAVASSRYPALRVIADQPGAGRFGAFSYPNAEESVSRFLARAQFQQPGSIPILTTYKLVRGQCGGKLETPTAEAEYKNWISSLAAGIGTYRAVLTLEQDSLITAVCLNRQQLNLRLAELRYAINTLTADCPDLLIYVDAGAADALPAAEAANLLERAGVAKIQGFFLNATHFDWTLNEIHYGEQISKLTGGKHFIVDTGESGRGPLVPRDRVRYGNEDLCNPPGRGLGPVPTTNTGFKNVDAFVWIDNPGGSDGNCPKGLPTVPGAPASGNFWPKYALMLAQNADYKVR